MLQVLLGLLSAAIGVTVTVQSAVNGRLRHAGGNPLFASCASNVGGLAVLLLALPAVHLLGIWPMPGGETLAGIQWWMYSGGIIGAAGVIGAILIPQRIGFGSYFSMLVAGQLVGSVLADWVGLLGAQVHAPGPGRVLGAVCLVAGALLVQRSKA